MSGETGAVEQEQLEKIVELFIEFKTVKAIASEVNLPPTLVLQALVRFRVDCSRRNRESREEQMDIRKVRKAVPGITIVSEDFKKIIRHFEEIEDSVSGLARAQ